MAGGRRAKRRRSRGVAGNGRARGCPARVPRRVDGPGASGARPSSLTVPALVLWPFVPITRSELPKPIDHLEPPGSVEALPGRMRFRQGQPAYPVASADAIARPVSGAVRYRKLSWTARWSRSTGSPVPTTAATTPASTSATASTSRSRRPERATGLGLPGTARLGA